MYSCIFRYEGPPRRRYYRRNNQGYTTYGSAQARSTYDRGTGQRWRYESEYSAGERKERLMNTIFFGYVSLHKSKLIIVYETGYIVFLLDDTPWKGLQLNGLLFGCDRLGSF